MDKIDSLYLDIAKYMPFKGGVYIDLPSYYKKKKAIINIKYKGAKGDDYFRMMIRSALFPTDSKIANRPSSYPPNNGLNLDGIDEPTPISQIDKVEKQNNLAINVFEHSSKGIVVHRISSAPELILRIN